MSNYNEKSLDAVVTRLLARMDAIENRFDGRMDRQDALLEKIEVQTTKTNGRVSKLETIALAIRTKVLAFSMAGSGLLYLIKEGFLSFHKTP